MTNKSYWLDQRDADFVISAVERYDRSTQAHAEQDAAASGEDYVYEITVTRHQRMIKPVLPRDVAYPTLKSALLADEREVQDTDSIKHEASDFPG